MAAGRLAGSSSNGPIRIDVVTEKRKDRKETFIKGSRDQSAGVGAGAPDGSTCASAPRHGKIFEIPGLDSKAISRFDYSWKDNLPRSTERGVQVNTLIMRREVTKF